MTFVTEPERQTPVVEEVDVLVAGGGPAGTAAATFAARNGAKTMLVERYGFLGGMATQALFSTLPTDRGMGLQSYGGFPQEILSKLLGCGSAHVPERKPRTGPQIAYFNDIHYNEEMLKLVLDEALEDAGVEILLHSQCVAPIASGGRVKGVVVENKSGRGAVFAKVVIDATGDGDIAARAGVPYGLYEEGFPLPPFDWKFLVANVNWDLMNPDDVRRVWEELHKDRPTTMGLTGISRQSRWLDGIARIGLKSPRRDAVSAADLTAGELEFRREMRQLLAALRSKAPGFEDAHLIKMSAQIEVEATRRVKGDYVLTKDDVLGSKRFPDTIAVTPPRNRQIAHFPPGTSTWHGIPYRCLLPQGTEGLLTAGRCISTEYEAVHGHPSIIGCMLIGQAAGTAAALAVRDGIEPRKVNVPELQKSLVAQGAELSNGM